MTTEEAQLQKGVKKKRNKQQQKRHNVDTQQETPRCPLQRVCVCVPVSLIFISCGQKKATRRRRRRRKRKKEKSPPKHTVSRRPKRCPKQNIISGEWGVRREEQGASSSHRSKHATSSIKSRCGDAPRPPKANPKKKDQTEARQGLKLKGPTNRIREILKSS